MAKRITLAVAAFLILSGILGFFPNVFIGKDAFFESNTIYNISRIAFGCIVLGVAYLEAPRASQWLKVLGYVYVLRFVLGFIVAPSGGLLFNALSTNVADHFLHLVVGLVLIGAGFMDWEGKQKRSRPHTSSAS